MTEAANMHIPDWMVFVGKWGDAVDGHPLVFHLLDSAAVAEQLWQAGLTPGARAQFSSWLGLPAEDCGRLLSYWTSLHDLGKATPTFQRKHAPTRTRLVELGFDFPDVAQGDIRHHSLLSQWILSDYANVLNISPGRIFNLFRFAIGGHHGSYHALEDQETTQARFDNLGGARWQQARRDLLTALTSLLNPPIVPALVMDQTTRNAFFNLLTGFFVTADWISSQDDYYPYRAAEPNLAGYWSEAQERARAALIHSGWSGWQPDGQHPDFDSLFDFHPHPLQSVVMQYAERLQGPFIMIVEAPTGCGKTEAALMAADQAIQAGGLRGCYIAMPTQATSNQMFDRVKKYLSRRYPDQTNINLHLAHGNAIINEAFQKIRLSAIDDIEGRQAGNVNAMDWFLPRKRTLLAPFGVGTVDQTFLSVLRARHSFLRLFGLHRKVVIFDEVHAYDVYMMELFTQLLAWLRAVGSSVILLSATLPEETRLTLLKAYQPNAAVQSDHAPYPRMSINDGHTIATIPLGDYPGRKVYLEKISRDSQDWIQSLRETLSDGGCVAVICNTVDRAQCVYQQLFDAGLVDPADLFLLHARMPYCWRKKREDEILARFGKQDKPATAVRRGIVVATQIIEQSLDLDFDLLMTDLAPIDLLIQRIGRLHRHSGRPEAPLRPPALRDPRCVIFQPDPVRENEAPVFKTDGGVYFPAILQRTFFALQNCPSLDLPADSDRLINLVYSCHELTGCSPEQNRLVQEEYRKMMAKEQVEISTAQNRMVGDVDQSNTLVGRVAYLCEEDRANEEASRALTRNSILPSVHLVCFIRQNGTMHLLDEDFACDPSTTSYGQALEHTLKSMVTVSKREVVEYFYGQPLNPAWARQAALRRAHAAVFENGVCRMDNGTRMILDEGTGLRIE